MHVTCVVGPYFWLENFSASLHYFISLLCVTNFNYFLIKMKFNKSINHINLLFLLHGLFKYHEVFTVS